MMQIKYPVGWWNSAVAIGMTVALALSSGLAAATDDVNVTDDINCAEPAKTEADASRCLQRLLDEFNEKNGEARVPEQVFPEGGLFGYDPLKGYPNIPETIEMYRRYGLTRPLETISNDSRLWGSVRGYQ